MLPVIAIGTGVFLALQLAQTHLSHSRSLADASIRIGALERELDGLRRTQRKQAESWGQGLGRVVRHVATLGTGAVSQPADQQQPQQEPTIAASTDLARTPVPASSTAARTSMPLEASIASTFGVNARARKALAEEQRLKESAAVEAPTTEKRRWWSSSN